MAVGCAVIFERVEPGRGEAEVGSVADEGLDGGAFRVHLGFILNCRFQAFSSNSGGLGYVVVVSPLQHSTPFGPDLG